MTQKTTQTTTEAGDELYISIMKHIDEDLLPEHIEGLDAKYAGETAEQHAERMQRYESAFDQCDRILDKMHEADVRKTRMLQKELQDKVRSQEERTRKREVSSVEEQLDSLDAQ